MFAAIYTRSSRDEHGVSCAAQEHDLRALADRAGDVVAQVFTDFQLSSTKDERPAFAEMMAAAKAGRFARLYVLNTSRIGRDAYQAAYARHHLRRECGVEIVYAQVPATDSVVGPLLESILGAIDTFHRDISAEGARRGQRQNVRLGFRAGGRAPYGYVRVPFERGTNKDGRPIFKTRLDPDPATAPVVEEIFLRIDAGETRAGICRDLTARGVLPPGGAERGNRTWAPSSITSLVANRQVYAGDLVYDRHPAKGRTADVLVVPDAHPAIVERALAERVFARSADARARYIRGRDRAGKGYALAGLVFCAGCGAPFEGNQTLYRPRSKGDRACRCGNAAIGRAGLETHVADMIAERVLPGFDADTAYRLWRGKAARASGGRADRKRIERELAAARAKVRRLAERMAEERIDRPEFREVLEGLAARERALADALVSADVARADFSAVARTARELFQGFRDAMASADLGARQRAFRTVIDRIEVGPRAPSATGGDLRPVLIHALIPGPEVPGFLHVPKGIRRNPDFREGRFVAGLDTVLLTKRGTGAGRCLSAAWV